MELPPGRALPNLIIIGAMKAATSALHAYLDDHPDVFMAPAKELCFFFDAPPDRRGGSWSYGNRHRGVAWYASHFPADSPVRGESSPGYTSPAHPRVAERMARLIPQVRLIMLVRDPVTRAISQYRHHVADGTERRPPAEALLDPGSQYLDRSRYHARLQPFLARFPRSQLLVVATEELESDRQSTMSEVFAFAGVDPDHRSPALARRHHPGRGPEPAISADLRTALREALAADADRLRDLLGRDLPGWTV